MMRKLTVILLIGAMCLSGVIPVLAQGQHATIKEYEKTTGNKIEEFSEAPSLRMKVAAGELPPVEERLPEEPVVVEPVEEIGQYGGTWNLFQDWVRPATWVTIYAYDLLVRFDSEGKKIIPNIAKSYEISEGGRVYTFHLRKGMRWSDGHPFTADDVMFWYEDMLLNEELTLGIPEVFVVAGESVKVEKVGDYTVRFSFVEPYGIFLENMAYTEQPFAPKHYLKQFHPRYTSKEKLEKMTEEEGLTYWYQLFAQKDDWYMNTNPDLPVLRAWVLRTTAPATRYVCERNPYYWKVDPEGNQLPYLDKVALNVVSDAEMINFKAMTGEASLQAWGITLRNFSLYKQNEEKGDYRVLLWPEDTGSHTVLLPNQNCKDEVARGLIRDLRFRKALSLAINRDEINEFCYLGLGTPRQATVTAGSSFYKEEYGEAYAQYDPKKANALLDEMELKWDKNQEYRLGPDGKTLFLLIDATVEQPITSDILELVKGCWEKIGIKTELKLSERSLYRSRVFTGENEIGTWNMTPAHYPYIPGWFVPISVHTHWAPFYGAWYATEGKSGEEPTGDIRELQVIWDEFKLTTDPAKKIELFQKILDLHLENLWMIGLVGELPHLLVVKNNFRNVPEKSLYSSAIGRYLGLARPEQFFIKQK